jgi:hypothetical protein
MFRYYIRCSFYFYLLICILSIPVRSFAQSLPVGTPVLEDALRRAQLLGEIDSSISFTSMPIFPVASMKLKNSFDPDGSLEKDRGTHSDGIIRFSGNRGILQLLPITWQQQYNSNHPEGWNDGAMIPARGYQTLFSAGVYAKYGPLSIQLRPEAVYAENRAFQGFYKEQSDQVWAGYYNVVNCIDLPERFGDKPYNRLLWGQSSIRLTFGAVSLGLSNENLWWGPGMRNSLSMSNSAEGFKHLTLNTVKPLRTFIGSFEGQIICGRLENSGFFPPDTSRTYNGNKLYVPKRNDWRYFNAVVLSYQPKWVPGLFLGLTRSFITYYKDMGHSIGDFFPIITPMTKKANYGDKESAISQDERASVFIRWLWLRSKAELYCEYFREDHAYDTRDLILEPDYEHAYLFGIRKMFPLNRHKDQYIQFKLEVTQLAQTSTNPERPEGEIYLHYAGISQGYTNKGQMLGAGIGPGSNLQSASISWIKSLKTIGIQMERYEHNLDFFNAVIEDPRANWVDISASVFGEWNYKHLIFSAKLKWVRCYNYEYLYQPISGAVPNYWDPGKNIYNFQAQIGVMHRF